MNFIRHHSNKIGSLKRRYRIMNFEASRYCGRVRLLSSSRVSLVAMAPRSIYMPGSTTKRKRKFILHLHSCCDFPSFFFWRLKYGRCLPSGLATESPRLWNDIINKFNNLYINLTVADTTINDILDTGSTDMWVAPSDGIGSFEDTGVPTTLHFGDRSTFVQGSIGLSEVEIAGFKIPVQAFLNVTQSSGFQFECSAEGICGLIGLGFDSPRSAVIPGALTGARKDATVGKSLLSSIFDQNPDKGINEIA
ncbi:hypothetical protein C8R44DRAFT_358800 [Mycena epipterygia]|nr:hypothetical protein C8R44DRAFT_358800 [Mycena epipterygia]